MAIQTCFLPRLRLWLVEGVSDLRLMSTLSNVGTANCEKGHDFSSKEKMRPLVDDGCLVLARKR